MPATLNRNAHLSTTHEADYAPHSKNAAREDFNNSAERDNPVQQMVKQAVDSLVQQLQAGKSEALTEYLAAMARFHQYSFGNILAIARQRPSAKRVAGFQTWKEMGRHVRKGEKGIQIFAPMIARRRASDKDAKDSETTVRPVLIGFRPVYVWDQSQTDGSDLPEFSHSISGEVGAHRDRLMDFLSQQNIALEYSEMIAPALGVSYGGRIAMLPGQSPAEEFTTLVHEAAHELLHRSERRMNTTKTVRETEAEAVAFVVGKALGLEMGTAASDYIQLYDGNASLIAESLEFIQRTSSMILAAIRPDSSSSDSAIERPEL